MNKRHLTASVALASALTLTACGGGGGGTDTAAGNAGSTSSTSSPSAETAKGNDADLAFLTGMKPHHEQAVEMSEMILAANPPAGATGTEAARLYLEGMIRHHQGAIEASETELVDGAYPPALKLADEIKQGQAAEITTMQALLASL